MCPGNLGYYNLEKMKNHHYPERQDTEGFPPSILSDLKIKQKGISILFCTALVTPEQSQPFQRDFEVNAIDMLGLKAQEGVQYAWGCGDTGKIVKAVWWAKIFICQMFCAGLVFYSRPSSRKFISNFSRVARLCVCCGVTDPVKPFWQAELKQLRRHISLDKEATGFSAAVWQMMRMIIIP